MLMPAMSSADIGENRTWAHAAAVMTTRRINATTVTRSRPLAAAGSGADSRGVSANIAGSLCRAPVPVQRSADARAHEVTDDRDGALGLVQHRQEPVPDVDH